MDNINNNNGRNGGVVDEFNLKPDIYTSVPNEYVTIPTAPEYNTESADEFDKTPEEFTTGSDTEASEEYSTPESEQAATSDKYNNFDEAYGKDDVYESESYRSAVDDFDIETAEDYDITDNEYDTETSVDYDVTESNSYDDNETAATYDCGYGCDCDRTTAAQQRCALDDYEIISDVLGCEKQLVKLYSTALCEAAEEPFRNIIRENLTECAADQYKTFEFMNKNGMYETEQAPEEQIIKTKEQFGPLCN